MTEEGHIPWSWLDLTDPVTHRLFIEACGESEQELLGNRGPCTCERPGFQRRNPNICRHCNKPLPGRPPAWCPECGAIDCKCEHYE